MSTQVRISLSAHQKLKSMAAELGEPMQDVLDKAVEAYRRKSFLDRVNGEFEELRSSPDAWAEAVAERRAWDVTLGDGLE
jgi:hypothetical protein